MKKLITGGQTGMDQMGLRVAKKLGIPTGGTAPKGFKTESGPDPDLGTEYGLVESYSEDYLVRTLQNIKDSDATVLFGNIMSAGSARTISMCMNAGKPYITNPDVDQLVAFIVRYNVEILNVAGNRMSKTSKLEVDFYASILRSALLKVKEGH